MSQQAQFGLIALEGGCNFRHISGYPAHGGRRLREGKLFRSGVLAHLSALDHERLQPLGIRTIIDLRHADERRHDPTRWCDQDAVIIAGDEDTGAASLLRLALRTSPTLATMHQTMIDVYRSMPESLAGRMRVLFERLLSGDLPLLIHCSAGKDRTGFATAMILEALGVDRSLVFQDYLYTNEAVHLEHFVLEHQPPDLQRDPHFKHPIARMDADARNALLRAHADYLDAALMALKARYGSIDGYLERRLGIDAPKLARIREGLLE